MVNYFLLPQSINMNLEGCHKFGFLIEEIPRSTLETVRNNIENRRISLIRSKLINNIEPQIDKLLLYVVTAKDIWDTTKKLYSKHQTASRLYTLQK